MALTAQGQGALIVTMIGIAFAIFVLVAGWSAVMFARPVRRPPEPWYWRQSSDWLAGLALVAFLLALGVLL